jgi:invasion protein IalB
MYTRLASTLFVMLALAAQALPALAQDKAKPKVLGNFGDWQALSYKEADGDVCYVASLPKKAEGHQIKPGEANLLVTHWPAKKSLGVISVTAGYEYKKDSEVQLVVGSEKFMLFTQGRTAWARDGGDAKIVEAMKVGKELVAHGVTGKGAATADTYALSGFVKAYEAASKACGVKG